MSSSHRINKGRKDSSEAKERTIKIRKKKTISKFPFQAQKSSRKLIIKKKSILKSSSGKQKT